MRILMLNYEFPPVGGGASPVTYNLCKWLVKKGHEVDVVTMGYKDLPNFEIVDGVNVYRVKCLRSKKEICYTYEMFSYVLSALPKLLKITKHNKYDIVHAHFIIPTGILAYFLKKYRGLDYIITSHGSDVLGYNKRFDKGYKFFKYPWKKIIRNSKLIITPSYFLRDKIKEQI
ncbi:MAG: glycosyltransferase family 4 protein, partial [Candidatus Nanoarchaeia archaeon]